MKEKKSKKEWIKSVAIVFLIVLLILTFFSNTIMNRSLPEVSAQYCYSGQVTNKVRGTGVVEANDPYVVSVKESRKVESVLVREGDTVSVGDVLYTLTDGESDELKAALDELDEAKRAYEKAVITGAVSFDITNSVEKEGTGSLESNQKKITSAKSRVESLKSQLDSAQKKLDDFNSRSENYVTEKKNLADNEKALDSWTEQKAIDSASVSEALSAYEAAKTLSASLQDKITAKEKQLKMNSDVSSNDYNNLNAGEVYDLENEIKEDKVELATLLAEEKKLQDTYNVTVANLNNSTYMVSIYEAAVENSNRAIKDKQYNLETQVSDIQDKYEKAQKAYDELLADMSTKYGLEENLKVIEEKQKAVDELKSNSIGGTITAPVAGTIISTSYVAGQTIDVQNAPEVAQIQKAGDLYSLTMTIPSSQAQLIGVGDEAEVANSWYYSDVHARVSQIRASKEDPAKSKVVVFEVEGNDLTDGMSLSLSVGNRTANYDMIVPKSAVREDNNGKFVLKVVSKETPLGIRYIAERVDVKVLAEDDVNSAISGNMESWEFIITTTSSPVESGNQVRLKE